MRWRVLIALILGSAFLLLINKSEGLPVTKEKPSSPELAESSERKPDPNTPMARSKEPSEKPYTSLVEKNIFSPERKEFPLFLTPSGPAQKPSSIRPQIILYGVTLAGEYQSASIVHQGRPLRKGERETLTLKPGEKIGEYKLTKILPDRIILETDEDRFEVLLYDATKPKPRTSIRTETKPASVTSAIAGPSPAVPQPSSPLPPVSASEKKPESQLERQEFPKPVPSSSLPGQERFVAPPIPTPFPQSSSPSIPPAYSPRRRVPLPTSPGTPSTGGTPSPIVPNEPGGP